MSVDEKCVLIRIRVGSNIRRIRKLKGQTQAHLAATVCIDRAHLSQIENGKENTSIDTLVRIADGLDCPVTDLFTGLEADAPRNLTVEYIEYDYICVPHRSW